MYTDKMKNHEMPLRRSEKQKQQYHVSEYTDKIRLSYPIRSRSTPTEEIPLHTLPFVSIL